MSDRDTVALQLPGFGCDAPAGFSGTRYAYRDWVIAELEALDGPVDLVGHDQGSVIGLVLWGRQDAYQAAEFGRAASATSGARFHELACGHWWQVERPDEVAAELTAHWSHTDSVAA
jgi:pimeloyl-ACP methyl ester carboxylesterase